MVAREGFEPSKPLGRQIYSLLRLTASLPRRISVARVSDSRRRSLHRLLAAALEEPDTDRHQLGTIEVPSRRAYVWGVARNLELAKGFEPPTG